VSESGNELCATNLTLCQSATLSDDSFVRTSFFSLWRKNNNPSDADNRPRVQVVPYSNVSSHNWDILRTRHDCYTVARCSRVRRYEGSRKAGFRDR
jgi:hypothetical protein